ncbi:carboxypeptidase-like regulatory domain-containing protein [Chitinophaga sedimenti]|uniref:carboxypeptidase-like regulatory domain-containing protein n=1 Tax=Chitinophaga sedimenti TaxID=2033606 RepID=UPI002005250B|nr:carboxypeptidase-like regulatory domain-containing protein [Chitinophaga sedimenti]MCK7554876.1 carboxypeptidase-like regulatory domain-containing protein [Chitinophaga sedimenti]
MFKNSTFACFVWLLLLGVCTNLRVQAQEVTGTVQGKVTGEAGEALPMASVKLKGTTNGVVSDANGNFRLERVKLNATLVISYVNYDEKEVTITDFSQPVQVKLGSSTKQLTDVVVVGYGATRKKRWPAL